MLSEQGMLALARILGTVLVLLVLIMTFGPTINRLIRKLLSLDAPHRDDRIRQSLREMESHDSAETDSGAPQEHIRLRCPNGHLLKNELAMVGQLTKCPVCAVEFAIPQPHMVDQGQAL